MDPFVAAAKDSPDSGDLRPGTFRLHKHMNAALAWGLLLNPKSQIQTVVTVPDGLRATAILARLSQDTGMPLTQFKAALADTAALGLPSYAGTNPEGYLYPATYTFQPGTTALQMLQTMVTQFKTATAALNLATAAATGHLTAEAVIIEASLLEAEGGPTYFGQIARVIDNRLNQKMPLGLDSTIEYGLNINNIDPTQSQLNTNSPYNTLNRPGLPPGPIDSPDLAAITAALHPPQGNWIYFVTVDPKTGLTKFTDSFSQFSVWKAEFQKNLKDGT